jgi:hypothetical protein
MPQFALHVLIKVKLYRDKSIGFQEVKAPRFPDNGHMKVVRLSALHTGHLYPSIHFC